jgi:hypothetical protein
VLSLADAAFEQDLGKIRFYDLSNTMRSLEARGAAPAPVL